jgi:thymidylate synthase (FAD)
MKVDYIDKMGTDLSVVNAARVSFSKESKLEIVGYEEEYFEDVRTLVKHPIYELKESDKKLINFLARENHWTPFGHCSLQVRVKAPIFVARQLAKHQIGLTWNEVSRRYVDSEPEFYFPENWRKKNPDKKQGSYEDEFVELDDSILQPKALIKTCKNVYNEMLKLGVCAEQARMILPQNMYTEWYWSGTLFAFARICRLRTKKDTQKETRDVANQIAKIAKEYFPVSWDALMCK